MRFYLDENLSSKIAESARARGLDILSSHECGQNGLPDEQQLKFAAGEGRCIVTRNRDDFILLSVRFFERGWHHYGVLIVPSSFPGSSFAMIAESLRRHQQDHPDNLPSFTIDFLNPK